MKNLEAIAAAAKNFAFTYVKAMHNFIHPDAIEANLEILEETIKTYRATETREPNHDRA